MNKVIALVFLVLIVVLSLLLYISKRPVVWKQATSEHFKLTVSYPETWRQSEDQTLFSLVDTKSKAKNFKTYMRISTINNKDDMFNKVYNLASGSQVNELSEKTEMTNRSAVKIANTEVGGRKAFEVYEETLMPGPYYSEAIYSLSSDKIYVFRLTAESRKELDLEKIVFAEIMGKLKLTSGI